MFGWPTRNIVGIWAFVVAIAWVPAIPSGATFGRWVAIGFGSVFLLLFTTVRPTLGHVLGAALLLYMAAGLGWTVTGWDTGGELLQWTMLAAAFCVAAELKSHDQFWIGTCLGITVSAAVMVVQASGLSPVTTIYFAPTGLFLTKNMAVDSAVLALIGGALTRWWLVPGPLLACWMAGDFEWAGTFRGSRAEVIALTAGGLAAAWSLWPRARRGLVVVTSIAAVAAVALLATGRLGKFDDRFEIWSLLVSHIHVLGDGLGSFAVAAPEYEYAHNEFLQYLFELGIGSAPLWILAVLTLAHADARERAVLGAFLALCVVWFPFHEPEAAFVAAMVAGRVWGDRRNAVDHERARRMVGASGLFDGPPDFVGAMHEIDYHRVRKLRRCSADLSPTRKRVDLVSA